jgi:hypothetical protein
MRGTKRCRVNMGPLQLRQNNEDRRLHGDAGVGGME